MGIAAARENGKRANASHNAGSTGQLIQLVAPMMMVLRRSTFVPGLVVVNSGAVTLIIVARSCVTKARAEHVAMLSLRRSAVIADAPYFSPPCRAVLSPHLVDMIANDRKTAAIHKYHTVAMGTPKAVRYVHFLPPNLACVERIP